MNIFKSIQKDLMGLFYPSTCAGCGYKLLNDKEVLCIQCDTDLPKTNFHKIPGNLLEKKFWGRCKFEMAVAMYFFEKNNRVQFLLHQLKYKNNEELGKHLGIQYGNEIFDTILKEYDYIIPVPLHESKQRSRGYNQCDAFAEALAETLHIGFENKNLQRIIANPSQTTKNRIDRWDNVYGIFQVKDNTIFENKKVIIVDDVVTTGATIEACYNALEKSNVRAISLISIAAGSM
jgi:competence protein ComFC